jgi:hypothetical protein
VCEHDVKKQNPTAVMLSDAGTRVPKIDVAAPYIVKNGQALISHGDEGNDGGCDARRERAREKRGETDSTP